MVDLLREKIMVRRKTNELLEMIDQALLDPKKVVLMCVKYMSEAEVADMMHVNGVQDNE